MFPVGAGQQLLNVPLRAEGEVIIGNSDHPEVQGIRGWAGENVTVIQSAEDAEGFSPGDKNQQVCIVSQTTFNYNKFKDLVEIIRKKGYDIIVLNTICNATKERQEEAARIAERVDVVILDIQAASVQILIDKIMVLLCENSLFFC